MPRYVTITEGLYTYDVNGENGKMFKPNHQYYYMGTTSINTVCCGPQMAYIIIAGKENPATYNIPCKGCVASDVKIEKHWQDFNKNYYNDFLQQLDEHSYRDIQNNCKNCNGDIFWGDYNNDVDTGGWKDPNISFKHRDL